MEKKALSGILVTLILFTVLSGVFGIPVVRETFPSPIDEPQQPPWPGDWWPFVPHPNLVDLELLTVDQGVSVEVTLWLTGCAVSDWGTLEQDGNNFWVDTEIWKLMGIVPQIIDLQSYIYDLGYLEAGNYTFTFKVWGSNVKSMSFTVPFIVENLPPIANFTYSPDKPKTNETVTFNASSSYDPDGTTAGYSWAFGDGIIANDTGPITTHAYTDAGNHTVTLYVYDDDYQSDSYALNVTVTRQQVHPCPDYVALNATYHALLANYSDLLDDYNELLGSLDSLVIYFDSINSSYYGLQSSHDSLDSTYQDLLDIYNQLQSDYEALESQHDTLTGDLDTAGNLSYLFIIATTVFIATTVYLTIRRHKVKQELKTN